MRVGSSELADALLIVFKSERSDALGSALKTRQAQSVTHPAIPTLEERLT